MPPIPVKPITKRTQFHFGSPWFGYGIAILIAAVSAMVRLAFPHNYRPVAPFLFFYPAIGIAAFLGGMGPGIAVIVIAGLFGLFAFPTFPALPSWIALSLFGGLITFGLARLRGLRDRSAAVALESARLRFVIEHVSDWIFLLDRDGRIEYANRTACGQLGYEPEELTGHAMEHLVAEANAPELARLLTACRETSAAPAEVAFLRRDGSPLTAEVSCTAIETGSTVVIHVAARDITERKQLDRKLREARQWESLGALSGGLAHDFNNLLTSIMGNASLAREMLADDREAVGLLEGVEQAGDRCAGLIHLMLATSGYRPRTTEKIRVDQMLERTIAARSFPDGVRVHAQAEACEIESDHATIETLLNGLILNAAESYASGGDVTVNVRVGPIPELGEASFEEGKGGAGDYLGIVVEDQGCGMSGDVAERAFNPFFTTKFMGRGLGLPAVRGIVRAHSGVLWMRTTPGEGTRVEVWLPVAGYHLSASAQAHA